jgi:L-fuculose-phosphate aldolase
MALFGRKAVEFGLTSSRFGNISLRRGDSLLITRTGSMLDELDPFSLVEVDLESPCKMDEVSSCETVVHRTIYQTTPAKAILHTHSPFAVAFSLLGESSLEPVDSEGQHLLGSVPVVKGGFGTQELAEKASLALRSSKACLVMGHGVFAIGYTLKEAYTVACMTEHSAQVGYLLHLWKRPSQG